MAKKKKKDLLNVASDIAKKVENTANTTVKKTVNNVVNESNNNVDNTPIKKNKGLDFSATTIKTSDVGKLNFDNEDDREEMRKNQEKRLEKFKEEQKKQEAEKIAREKKQNKKNKKQNSVIDNLLEAAVGFVVGGNKARNSKASAAMNALTGVGKFGENALDFMNDTSSAVNTNLEYLANRALGKSKKEATKIKKEEEEGNRDFVKRNLVQEAKDKTGVSKAQKAIEKKSWVKEDNLAGKLFQEAGYQAPILLLSAGVGDLGLATQSLKGLRGKALAKAVATNLGKTAIDHPIANLSLGTGAYGSGLEEAYSRGANEGQARKYALGNAALELGTEKISGGIPGLNNEGLIDDAAQALINRGTKNVKKKAIKEGIKGATKYATKTAGEGVEEVISELLSPALKNATYSKGEKINWNDVKEAGLMGTILGGALNAPSSINETRSAINEGKIQDSIDKVKNIEKVNTELKNNKIYDIANQIASANIKPNIENANLSTEVQQQMQDGRFGKKMMLDMVSTQKVQEINQALKQGQITPAEANEEMEVLKQTVEQQRKQINDEVNQDLEDATKASLKDFENAFNEVENSNLPQEQKLQVANELVKASEQINNKAENQQTEQPAEQQLEQDLVQNEVENNPQNEKYNQLKTLVDSGAIQEGSALYNDFKQLEKEITPKENTIQQPQQETNNEEIDIKQPEILDKMPKENKGFKGTLNDIKKAQKRIRQGVVDHLQPIYDIARKTGNMTLYHKGDAIQSAPQIVQRFLEKGQTNLQGKPYKNFTNYSKIDKLQKKIDNIQNNSNLTNEQKAKQINKLQEQIKQNQNIEIGFEKIYDMFGKEIPVKDKNTYLVHQLNLDRTSQGQNQFNFSKEQSEKVIKDLEKKHKNIKNWAENIWQYNRNQLQNMVDGGLITQEQADTFLNDTPHYVRIQRDVGNTNRPVLEIKNGNLKVNNPIQKTKGSELDTLPIKETTAEYTEQVMRAIKTNQFGQELAKTMGVSATGGDVSAVDEAFGINPDLIGEDANGNYTFTIFNNGVPTTMPINKEIARALTPRNIKTSNLNLAMHVAKIQKALLTDKNPVFMLTNGVKDFGDMMLYSKYSTARTLKTYAQLFGGRTAGRVIGKATGGQRIFENAPTAVEWLNLYESLGGNSSSIFNEGEFTSNKGKISKAIDKALTPIEKGNQFVESMPRLTEFVNTIEANGYTIKDGEIVPTERAIKKANKKGKTLKSVDEVINEAMYNAADITVNFKRGGTWTKNIDKNGAIYLSAGVQGASKFTRNITEAFGDAKSGNYKPAIRLMSRVVGLGIAPAVINQIMHGGDKDYEDEPEYIKDQYYLIGKTKDGDWIRIPKGRAVSLFESAARRTGRATNGGKFGLVDYAALVNNQIAPANPIESNVATPLINAATNKSYNGNDIVSDYLQTLPTEEQYDAKTSEISKWLGKTLGLSPKKVDYVLDQYSGGLGDLILPMTTTYSENKGGFDALINPLKSKFTTDPVLTNKTTSRYYDMIEDLEKRGNSKYADIEDKARQQYVGDRSEVKYHLNQLYSEQRDIQNDTTLTDAEKYRKNRKKQDEINKYMKKVIGDINSSESDGNGVVSIGDKTYAEYTNDKGKTTLKSVPLTKVVTAYNLGIDVGDYVRIDNDISNMHADKNSRGVSISGSKKRKAISYLKTIGFSESQIKGIINSYGWKY